MSSVREKIASFKVEAWFLQHVKRWLEASTESAPKCVENALKQEEVEYHDLRIGMDFLYVMWF